MLEVPECPVCLDTYDLEKRIPLILQCGHSICQNDLLLLVQSSNSDQRHSPLRCPTCKATFQYNPPPTSTANPGSLSIITAPSFTNPSGNIVRNFALIQLMENAMTMHGVKSPRALSSIPRCSAHPTKLLEFYCKECSLGVCSKCFLLTHKDHDMMEIEEVFNQQGGMQAVIETLELGQKALEQSKQKLSSLSKHRMRLLASKQSIQGEIAYHFDTLINAAQERKAKLLEEIEEKWTNQIHFIWSREEKDSNDAYKALNHRYERLLQLKEDGHSLPLLQEKAEAQRIFHENLMMLFLTEEEEIREAVVAEKEEDHQALLQSHNLNINWKEWSCEKITEHIHHMGQVEFVKKQCSFLVKGQGLRSCIQGDQDQVMRFYVEEDDIQQRRKRGETIEIQVQIDHLSGEEDAYDVSTTVEDCEDGLSRVSYRLLPKKDINMIDKDTGEGKTATTLVRGSGRRRQSSDPSALFFISPITTTSTTTASVMAARAFGLNLSSSSSSSIGEDTTITTHVASRRDKNGIIRDSSYVVLPSLQQDYIKITVDIKSKKDTEEGYIPLEEEEDEDKREEQQQWSSLFRHIYHVPVYSAFLGQHIGVLSQKGSLPGELNGPGNLFIEEGSSLLWIGDGDNHRIQCLDLAEAGRCVAEYGSPHDGGKLKFHSPYGISLDDVYVYVAERDAHQVTVLEKYTGHVVKTIGQYAAMKDPLSVAVNEKYVAVTDSSLNRVIIFDKKTGTTLRIIGPNIPPEAKVIGGHVLSCPCDVLFDEEYLEGHGGGGLVSVLYITDREASRLLVFAVKSGAFLRQIGRHGVGIGELNHVNRIAIQHDHLYATDRFGNRVIVYDKYTGRYLTSFGEGYLQRPNGLAVWKNHVLVADFIQSKIHIFR